MKNLVLVSSVVAALFMAGCSSKAPVASTSVPSTPSVTTEMMDDSHKLPSIGEQIQNQVQNVYFDFDKYSIRSDMQSVISSNANLFNQNGAESINIVVEGNCDEWGSDEYNYALGLKRAKAAKDALVAQGVDADRIDVLSNGESKPVCGNKGDAACDAKNRRDEFKVVLP